MTTLYLEDLAPGQRYVSAPMRLDGAAAERLGEFAPASPMHVAGLSMRLLVDGPLRFEGGILGAGIADISWPNPAVVGDELHVECELLEVRRSKSRPDRGLAVMRNTTRNASGAAVQIMTATCIVPARTTA